MLYLNIGRVMKIRGIENHYRLLIDLGITPQSSRTLLGDEAMRISFEHLEKVCLALNCTPNDIIEWQPNQAQANPEAQALIKLKRDESEDLSKIMKSLPIEKFDEIIGIIHNLKDKG